MALESLVHLLLLRNLLASYLQRLHTQLISAAASSSCSTRTSSFDGSFLLPPEINTPSPIGSVTASAQKVQPPAGGFTPCGACAAAAVAAAAAALQPAASASASGSSTPCARCSSCDGGVLAQRAGSASSSPESPGTPEKANSTELPEARASDTSSGSDALPPTPPPAAGTAAGASAANSVSGEDVGLSLLPSVAAAPAAAIGTSVASIARRARMGRGFGAGAAAALSALVAIAFVAKLSGVWEAAAVAAAAASIVVLWVVFNTPGHAASAAATAAALLSHAGQHTAPVAFFNGAAGTTCAVAVTASAGHAVSVPVGLAPWNAHYTGAAHAFAAGFASGAIAVISFGATALLIAPLVGVSAAAHAAALIAVVAGLLAAAAPAVASAVVAWAASPKKASTGGDPNLLHEPADNWIHQQHLAAVSPALQSLDPGLAPLRPPLQLRGVLSRMIGSGGFSCAFTIRHLESWLCVKTVPPLADNGGNASEVAVGAYVAHATRGEATLAFEAAQAFMPATRDAAQAWKCEVQEAQNCLSALGAAAAHVAQFPDATAWKLQSVASAYLRQVKSADAPWVFMRRLLADISRRAMLHATKALEMQNEFVLQPAVASELAHGTFMDLIWAGVHAGDGGLCQHGAALHWLLQTMASIAYCIAKLHAAGVAHQDLKPANILFVIRNGILVPVLGDLGAAYVPAMNLPGCERPCTIATEAGILHAASPPWLGGRAI